MQNNDLVRVFGAGFIRPAGRVYLDSAATSLMPRAVLAAQANYYATACANPHTNAHNPGRSSTTLVEESRAVIANLFRVDPAKWAVVFVGTGSTAALNRAAAAVYGQMSSAKRRAVISTDAEHHSNLLPWQRLAGNSNVHSVPMRRDGSIDISEMAATTARLKGSLNTIACTWASNVTGAVTDIASVAQIARSAGVPLVLDAAQAAPHMPLIIDDSVTAVALSGHKMFAPGSPGVLLIRRAWLETKCPIGDTGGGVASSVSSDGVIYNSRAEDREEAGTPNVPGVLALGVVSWVLSGIGIDHIRSHEHDLTQYALDRLRVIPGITIYGSRSPGEIPRLGVISFNLDVPHPAVAAALDSIGICVRNECFCAQPCVRSLLAMSKRPASKHGKSVPTRPGMVRASFGPWNTIDDVDALVDAVSWIANHPDEVCSRCAPCGGGRYLFTDPTRSTMRPCYSLSEEVGRAASNW